MGERYRDGMDDLIEFLYCRVGFISTLVNWQRWMIVVDGAFLDISEVCVDIWFQIGLAF